MRSRDQTPDRGPRPRTRQTRAGRDPAPDGLIASLQLQSSFGSVARGNARPDSDVDLLVTWSEGTSLLDQAALMLEIESL